MSSPSSAAAGSKRRPARLTQERRIRILKALADPHRFQLLEQIARASLPLGCSAARTVLAISPATLSHHVKELENAGIIRIVREGRFHSLVLRPEALESLIMALETLLPPDCEG